MHLHKIGPRVGVAAFLLVAAACGSDQQSSVVAGSSSVSATTTTPRPPLSTKPDPNVVGQIFPFSSGGALLELHCTPADPGLVNFTVTGQKLGAGEVGLTVARGGGYWHVDVDEAAKLPPYLTKVSVQDAMTLSVATDHLKTEATFRGCYIDDPR